MYIYLSFVYNALIQIINIDIVTWPLTCTSVNTIGLHEWCISTSMYTADSSNCKAAQLLLHCLTRYTLLYYGYIMFTVDTCTLWLCLHNFLPRNCSCHPHTVQGQPTPFCGLSSRDKNRPSLSRRCSVLLMSSHTRMWPKTSVHIP